MLSQSCVKTIVPELDGTDHNHLDEAEGWLGLSLWRDALESIAHVSEQNREHPDVLCCQSRALAMGEEWEKAAEISRRLCQLVPTSFAPWIRICFSLFKLDRIGEAKQILSTVAPRFPKEPTLRWYLAIFAWGQGNMDEAKIWIRRAVALTRGPRLKALARDQPEFYAMWKKLEAEDKAARRRPRKIHT
jgi:hypothetical protein